jgi:hypothetical protein
MKTTLRSLIIAIALVAAAVAQDGWRIVEVPNPGVPVDSIAYVLFWPEVCEKNCDGMRLLNVEGATGHLLPDYAWSRSTEILAAAVFKTKSALVAHLKATKVDRAWVLEVRTGKTWSIKQTPIYEDRKRIIEERVVKEYEVEEIGP